MAVARRSAGSLWNSPGSRVLRAAMAADMGSVLKLGNSRKSSSHRLTSRSRTTRPLSANTTGSCRRSRHLVSENAQTPRRWPSGTSLPTRSDTRSIRACRGGSLRRLPLLPDRTGQIAGLNIGDCYSYALAKYSNEALAHGIVRRADDGEWRSIIRSKPLSIDSNDQQCFLSPRPGHRASLLRYTRRCDW